MKMANEVEQLFHPFVLSSDKKLYLVAGIGYTSIVGLTKEITTSIRKLISRKRFLGRLPSFPRILLSTRAVAVELAQAPGIVVDLGAVDFPFHLVIEDFNLRAARILCFHCSLHFYTALQNTKFYEVWTRSLFHETMNVWGLQAVKHFQHDLHNFDVFLQGQRGRFSLELRFIRGPIKPSTPCCLTLLAHFEPAPHLREACCRHPLFFLYKALLKTLDPKCKWHEP